MLGVRRRDWLQLVTSGLCVSAVARALPSVRPLGLRELVDASSLVVVGTPEKVRSEWLFVFGQRRLVSRFRVTVNQPLVGAPVPSFELTTLGGTMGNIQQWVPHEAQLGVGQAEILFVMPGERGALWVTGMLQGAYVLKGTDATEPRVVLSAEQQPIAEHAGSAAALLNGRSVTDVADLLRDVLAS